VPRLLEYLALVLRWLIAAAGKPMWWPRRAHHLCSLVSGSRGRSSRSRSAGTWGTACRTGTWRSCWPSAASPSITSPSTGGCSGLPLSSSRRHVGQPRAQQVRDYLTELARTWWSSALGRADVLRHGGRL